MKPVANWRDVLRHAWSVRMLALALVAALFTGVEQALPLLQGALLLPPLAWAAITVVLVGAGFLARLLFQEELSE